MDFDALYHFIFETYAGIGILVGCGVLISIVYCIFAERKTRRVYQDKGPRADELIEEFEEGEEEGMSSGKDS